MASDPDDLTLVSQLMAVAATTLDRCDVSQQRSTAMPQPATAAAVCVLPQQAACVGSVSYSHQCMYVEPMYHQCVCVHMCVRGCLQAARRRKAPLFGSNKKSRELDRRQTLERVAAQRAALAASRVGLPGAPQP